jgi:hypothetical protein
MHFRTIRHLGRRQARRKEDWRQEDEGDRHGLNKKHESSVFGARQMMGARVLFMFRGKSMTFYYITNSFIIHLINIAKCLPHESHDTGLWQ